MPVRRDDVYLFHYTNPRGSQGILRDKLIRVTPAEGRFAWFGQGVYMTTLAPSAGRHQILYNNHHKRETKDPNLWAKTSVYFRISSDQLAGVSKQNDRYNRDVWVYPDDIDLRLVPFSTGLSDRYNDDDDDDEAIDNYDVTPYRIVPKPLPVQPSTRPYRIVPKPLPVQPSTRPVDWPIQSQSPRPSSVRSADRTSTPTVINIPPPVETEWSSTSSRRSNEDNCCCIIL